MPRKPYPVVRARRLLQEWLAIAVTKSTSEMPITVEAAIAYLVSRGLPTHRATLFKYDLVDLLEPARHDQAVSARSQQRDAEQEAYYATLDELRRRNAELEMRNRELLGQIGTMLFNARRLSISHDELNMPMPKTDRSRSRAGTRGRRGKAQAV